jgi:hypothetical protein
VLQVHAPFPPDRSRPVFYVTCFMNSRDCALITATGVLLVAFAVSPSFAVADDVIVESFDDAIASLRQHCGDCHQDSDEGGFALQDLEAAGSLGDQFPRWQKVRGRIVERTMPPSDCEPLPDELRQSLTSWIEAATLAAVCREGPAPGPPLLRRLAKHEYSNTIRDLLDIHFDAGQILPEDSAGGEGFNNAAETLFISPIHAEKYLQAAIDALDYAAHDEGARSRLLRSRPDSNRSDDGAARENLRELADRAFRRPVSDQELERYVQIFRDARADEMSQDESVLYAMRGILISPGFLFISETSPEEPGVSEPLSGHELATRLSYFLWASTPDDELRQAADAGRLQDDDELKKQTLRLLKARGTHLQDSMEQFVGNWLGTADLGRSKKVDRERHPWVRDPDVAAMRNQPIYTMESILQENDPITALIDAPWAFLNNELARVYGINKNDIKENFVQRLVRVDLPEKYRYRGGLLGMGGVLSVSAYPRRSSPVLRGAWVLEKMLGVELPPPPPDVPSLDDSAEASVAETLRGRLEQHRQDAGCAACHNRIDPIGFALENFDELGRWRDKDEGGPIDPLGKLADGTEIDGIAGLKQHMMANKETFARVLTRKMLGYALGRSLRATDLCTVESILHRLKENEYRSHELVMGIVMSEPFRQKMSVKGESE